MLSEILTVITTSASSAVDFLRKEIFFLHRVKDKIWLFYMYMCLANKEFWRSLKLMMTASKRQFRILTI